MDTAVFLVSRLGAALIRPDTWVIVAVGLIVGALVAGRRRLALGLAAPTFAALLALAILPLGDLLLQPIERTFPTDPPLARVDGIVVLGGGAWGTALALVAARAGAEVMLWARDADVVAAINAGGMNPRHLPGVTLAREISATNDPECLKRAGLVIAAVPAQSMRLVLRTMGRSVAPATPIVSAAKGLERGTRRMMSEVIAEEVPEARPAVLSGPSFAADVARGLPTALTIAAGDLALAERIALALASPSFPPYATADMIGAPLGGAPNN
eukprot:gene34015-39735_t